MSRKFYTLDVFTNAAFGGNPLAVVFDAQSLESNQMQSIAREFNLSETVFVTRDLDESGSADIRIFTPGGELPFAGHPTVGTAVLLAQLNGMSDGDGLVLNEKIGPVHCTISKTGDAYGATFKLPQIPTREPLNVEDAQICEALGLAPEQLGLAGHENSLCSAGVPFPTVPVRDLDCLAAINTNVDAINAMSHGDLPAELYAYTKPGLNAHYRVRLFAPGLGIPEDPATGSAAASFAAQILAFDPPADGQHQFTIEQGEEMGRPSTILLTMRVEGGALVEAHIGGGAVLISRGELLI